MANMRPSGHLLLLCALLCVWEPVNLALAASRNLGELATDSIGQTAFLGFRLLVAASGIAAGVALWNRRPHAVALAQVALTWLLANPTVTSAIIGANTVQQLAELIPAVSLTLFDDEKARLDNLKSPA